MRILFLLTTVLLVGCGGAPSTTVAVSGQVMLNGQPVDRAELIFYPTGTTKGNGGQGTTDTSGRYLVRTPQGSTGLMPGSYKVVISRRLNPDGSAPDPNVPPIESQARETLPPNYSSQDKSTLTLNVPPEGTKTADFTLKAATK